MISAIFSARNCQIEIVIVKLQSQRILITGASSGIGRATALTLAQLGASCVVCGRDEGRLDSLITEMYPGDHRAESFDLERRLSEIPEWIKQLFDSRPLTGLVHCAGLEVALAARMFDETTFDKMIRTNTTSALMLIKGFRQKGCFGSPSSVVFVSSIAALVGQPGHSMYCATKGAVNAMTRALAVELARDGIRVNAVCPGYVETDMGETLRSRLSPEQFQKILNSYPLGLGKPADVAHAVSFLISEQSRWITGSTLVVDGGHSAH